MKTLAYAAQGPTTPLAPFTIERRAPQAQDVQIEIMYCGVCHSDLHMARNEWNMTMFPIVPGHEIVGRVSAVGSGVRKFKVGDIAAVGCMVDSCRRCDSCRQGLEQYCAAPATFTYNGADKHGPEGVMTYGGYSRSITVTEDFVLRVPENLDPAGAAPLLCAGITTWSPLREWKVGKGQKVGIVGLGGLGHMGVKLASALGAHVVLFTTSPSKAEDARRLGAHEVVISRDADSMAKHQGSFDFLLNTVSAPHDINALLLQLRRDGTMVLVGLPDRPHPPTDIGAMIFQRRRLAGSLIGGIKETQEMLDFCGERNIVSDIEKIRMDQINEAYERMLRSDVRYRFVIDMATLK
jgi:alcohol dehydrogenase (NADP+)